MDIVELGMDVDSRPLNKTNAEMDRFAKEGKRVDGAARGVEKSTGAMAAGMKRAAVAVAATVGAMASLGASVRILADFEKQMSTVGAVSRATAGEMQAMRDIAADLGSTTEFTAKQAGEGLEFLARAGFSAAESVKAIPAVLDLATAAAMDLGSAADISSNIMSAFSIEAGNAAAVADVLAAASSRANTDVGQLGDAMSFVGPVASSLDIAMSDAAAAIGVLSDAGIQGSSAGTGLRRVLSSLANPTTQAQAVLSSLGLEMESLNPQMNDLTDIVDRLSASGLSAADALTIFGDRGGPAILALTSQTGRLEELSGALTDVEGESARMANTMRDNLGGDIDSLGSSIQGLVIALGDAGLTAVIRTAVQALTGLARGVTAVVDAVASGVSAVRDFMQSLLGAQGNQGLLQQALDQSTTAMGDQIRQTNELSKSLRSMNNMTLESARVKLVQAQATRDQIEAERQRLMSESGFARDMQVVWQQIQNQREDIAKTERLITLARQNGHDIAREDNTILEKQKQVLAGLLQEQQAIKKEMEAQNYLSEEQQAAYDQATSAISTLEAGIKAAENGMLDFNDETGEAVELTERLGYLASSINFDNATASAGLLARQLGLGMEAALGMNAALNRSAGIQVNDNAAIGLSFPGGTPDGSAPGSFTGAGGQLIFGDLSNAPDPADFKSFVDEIKRGGSVAGGTAKQTDDLSKKIKQLEFEADPVSKYNSEIDALNELMATGELSSGAYEAELQKLNDGLADQIPMVNDVADAWGDFVANGFRDFKGFVDSVLGSFKNMISQMISTAARNRILLSLGVTGAGAAGGTAAAAGGLLGGGGGGGLLGGAGLLGGILGTGGGGLAGLAGSGGILGGIGSVASGVSGILSGGGLSASFANLGGLLSGSAGGLGAIGAALPALGVVAAGVGLIVGFFKKSKELINKGIRVVVEDEMTSLQSFQDIKTSKFFGLSSSTDRSFSGVPEEFRNAWNDTMSGITSVLGNAADQLGLAGENFMSVWDGYNLDIATKGLSEDQVRQKVNEVFQQLANDITQYGLEKEGVGHLIEKIVLRDGEALSDAFQRLGNTLTSANATLKDLDLVLFDIGVEGANAAVAFTDLFGGMQAFNESASFYMQNFFSEQERLEKTTAKLTDAFGDLGVTMPNTRAQFRAMVEEASRLGDTDLVAAMLQLSPAFAQITNQITNDAQSLAEAQTQVAEAYRALETAVAQEKRRLEQEAQAMIAPLRAEIRSVQADADAAGTALNDAFSALSDFVSGEIDRINEVADAAIVPLREEIETLGDAAQDAQDALEAAFAQVEDNIAREINAIREATEAASGPLRTELDALRTTADDASAALAAARGDLDALITDRIAALQSELSDAVAGFEDAAVAARSAADAARTALGAAFDQVETNINREIAAIQSATDDAIVPLEAEIDALRATADATSSALSAARSDFDSFISGRISSIEAGLTDAVRPLEDELDALRTAASEASRALESARSELEGLISGRISNIEANLSSAVSDLEAVSQAARNAASAAEDVFRNTFDDLTESLKAERAVIAGEFEAQLTSLSNALDRASGGLGDLRSIIDLVDGAVSSIGPLNEAIELRQRRAAQAQLAGFAGGSSFTPDDLESAIGGLGGDPTKFFSDRSSFEMDQAKTRAALVAIGEDAGSQLSSAERQIQLLEQQIETTEATRDAELAVIDEQIAQAERLFNETLKIAANTTALDASMTGLRAAADNFLAKQIQAAETEARIADEIAILRREAASQIEELRAIRDAVLGSEEGPETVREAVVAFEAAVSADADARAALEIRGASIEAAILTLEQNAEAQIAELQSIRDAVLGNQPVFANVDEGVQAVRAAAAADAEAQAALVEQTGIIQGEITSLREGAEAQIAVLQEQLAQAQATFDEATGATQAITDVDASVRALHQAASNYLAKLDAARAVEEQSAAAIEALREETAAQIAELEAIRDASVGAQEGVQTVAEAVSAVEAAITADSEAQSTLAERGAAIEAELTALRENADAQVAALEAQLEQAQAAFDAATGADQAITDIADSVDALHLAIEAAAQAEAAFQSAQAANTDQIDAINAARDAQIAKLEEQLALAQKQFDEARGQSEGITSIDAGIAAFNDALATFTEAQSIVDSVTAANEGIIASIEAGLAADLDALDQQLDAFSDLKDETVGVADAVANVEAAIDRLSNVVDGQMAESEKENERLQQIIDTLRDEVTARFAAPVQQLYQETLGRDAGQTALDNAVTALREGQITQSDLRQQLRTSTEYRNHVWPEALDAAAQAALGRDATAADEALYWKLWKERGATMADIQAAMEASLVPETPARDTSPYDWTGRDRRSGKAGGGMFGGGVRMVGETGPELEVTGPSRIYNHGETSRMLDNRHVVEELRALRGEVSMLRDENAQLQASSMRFAKKTSDTLKKFDVDGLPKERT